MNERAKDIRIEINKIKKAPDIPNMVVDQIVRLISSGELKPGDKLPSELEMTRRFGISRISLREAMKLLEAKGYIESQGRRGKFVRSVMDNALSSPIEGMISVDHRKIWELLAVRRIIDSEAAFLAAEKATDRQMKTLREFRRDAQSLGTDRLVNSHDGGKLYTSFYNNLADATNNTIFAHIMKSIATLLKGALPYSRQKLQKVPDSSKMIYEQHIAILECIEKRDPDGAKKAVIEHIDYIEKTLRRLLR